MKPIAGRRSREKYWRAGRSFWLLPRSGDVHGWLFHGGKYYVLNDPTGCKCDTRDDGINDKLEMVGRYSTTLGGASIGFKVITK
jgi:hypothetical protein